MTTEILLARHGKTLANIENRFAGRTNEPLHPDGEEQLIEVAANLKDRNITAIYSGPLRRTAESARIISHLSGAPVHFREALNEINLPHWDGLTKKEITDRFGQEYPTWLAYPQYFKVPGCETLEQVQERAVAETELIFSAHYDQTVLMVSHLIVVRCLILHYDQRPISEFRNIKIDNASLTRLSRNTEGKTTVSFDL